ncbi:calcium-binding protein [Sulfitobacter aestuarii]|uniref:Calcium-binding protein n=1 Tax=Sulfitobacter aestuarii TaxID=2161676 RepID=A0ABW5U6L1_9RHOB
MSHLDKNYTSFEQFLNGAESIYSVNLASLNSSGVTGSAIFAIGATEDSGEKYLNVSIAVEGMEANVPVPQHIHGLFGDEGEPIDSVTPDINSDADKDGIVEVLEGLGSYGDVLLPLSNEDGELPTTNADGSFTYIMSFDLNDDSNFFSPVSDTDYEGDDILPLNLREVVLHGVSVPSGIGAGTDGEVDGTQDGFVPILPAAAGEIEAASLVDALETLDRQRDIAGLEVQLEAGAAAFAGTDGNDEIRGSDGDDTAAGLAGDDTLAGNGGDDDLSGDAGSDVIDGGTGNDTLRAGSDDDNSFGMADVAASGALPLSEYDNGYAGGAGDDLIEGGAGDDIITGDDDSRVSAAAGTMFNADADGSDTIMGGAGNDEIHTGSWSDSDNGLANGQTGVAGDVARGGEGDDILRGAGGDDFLAGDEGNDDIGGGGGNDSITGNDGDDVLSGGAGDDLISSGDGADMASGGEGNDSIGGGLGDDMLSGDAGNDAIGGGQGNDSVDGGDGDDIANGGDGNDMVSGGAGQDTLGGGDGDDMVEGGAGDDDLGGGLGDDMLNGGAGDDLIGGGDGMDIAHGGTGDDFVAGGDGDDQLFGDAGMDKINGGNGDDVMSGGVGKDTFVFNSYNDGEVDVITDFATGMDQLLLRDVDGGFSALAMSDVDGDAQITYQGHSIVLADVDVSVVSESDFIFG